MVVRELESPALFGWITDNRVELVSADLARTELLRAVRRTAADRVQQARATLDTITLIAVSTRIFDAAGHLDPSILRTLDALHLTVALELGDDLEGVVTYDDRMADAARTHGMTVIAPN